MEMATHSSILAWISHGWRSLVGYSPWGHKELDTTERLHFLFFYGNNEAWFIVAITVIFSQRSF